MPSDRVGSSQDDEDGRDDRDVKPSRSAVDGFRSGDPATVQEVQQRVERIIAFSGFRIPPADQEELCQEVLAQLWRGVNREGFDRDRGFWGFVQTIAARRCIDWLRTRGPELVELDAPSDSGRGPLGRLLDRERQDELSRIVERLPLPCRQLIQLRITEERSYADISRQLGRSEQALRAQMYRCIGRARDLVGAVEVEDEAS